MVKFHFSIQTREGQKINSVIISGRDQEHAEIKLRQMYRHCEVLQCNVREREEKRWQTNSIEDILTLIAK
jgi:hypothetical protein